MSARIIWACDMDGCTQRGEVVPTLAIDGAIDGNDCWPPGGWGGIGTETLCPEHEQARYAAALAAMKPDETWMA